jgi:hypothetical protein
MQEKHLFEYAVIRVVPCVEREEFINVGVIMYCASRGFLKTKFELNEARLHAFSEKLDIDELKDRLKAFEFICKGGKEGGTIGSFPVASRFRWLTATRSTVVQTSPVHPGLCEDPVQTLEKLYTQLVD